jgi:hypothetical protein
MSGGRCGLGYDAVHHFERNAMGIYLAVNWHSVNVSKSPGFQKKIFSHLLITQ